MQDILEDKMKVIIPISPFLRVFIIWPDIGDLDATIDAYTPPYHHCIVIVRLHAK